MLGLGVFPVYDVLSARKWLRKEAVLGKSLEIPLDGPFRLIRPENPSVHLGLVLVKLHLNVFPGISLVLRGPGIPVVNVGTCTYVFVQDWLIGEWGSPFPSSSIVDRIEPRGTVSQCGAPFSHNGWMALEFLLYTGGKVTNVV